MQSSIPPAVGWRQNMIMAPQENNDVLSNTIKMLTGPGNFMLGDGQTWVSPAGATYGDGSGLLLTSVGLGGRGSAAHNSINVQLNANNGGDGANACVSDENTPGGLAIGDPYGTIQPNSLYNIFMCGRDPSFAPNDWGMTFVLGSGPNGRAATAGPPAATQAIFPFYSPIDFFWTDSTGTIMRWLTDKNVYLWRFVGGSLPEIASGSTNGVWTEIFTQPATPAGGSSDNTGTFDVVVCAIQTGKYADVASNARFGNYCPARANGSNDGQYRYTPATVIPNEGGMGYRSTDPQAFVFLVGGTDGF